MAFYIPEGPGDRERQIDQTKKLLRYKVKKLREEVNRPHFDPEKGLDEVIGYCEAKLKLKTDPLPTVLTDEQKLEVARMTEDWYKSHKFTIPERFSEYTAGINGKNGKGPESSNTNIPLEEKNV